jgi:hypothetical protein
VPLLSLLFAVIVCALALGLWQTVRMSRAEAAAANAEAIAEARDRADLLAKELNHRVKNLFAVILAVVKMSARGDTAAAPAVDRISKRIHALVTAHDVTQGGDGAEADSRVDLADLIGKTIAPYRSSGERCVLDGPALAIDGRRHAAGPGAARNGDQCGQVRRMGPRGGCWKFAGRMWTAACGWSGARKRERPAAARRRQAGTRRLWIDADAQLGPPARWHHRTPLRDGRHRDRDRLPQGGLTGTASPTRGSRPSGYRCLASRVDCTMPGVMKPSGPGSIARFFSSPFIRA